MAFHHLPLEGKGRIVILSGPGGPAVSAADAVERMGLQMASLGPETIQKLRALLPAIGTSYKNPVDVSLSASFDLRLYVDTLDIIARDKGVDAVLILGGANTDEMNLQYIQGLVRVREKSGKAILAIAFPGFFTQEGLLDKLYEANIPVYSTPERALRAYAKINQFYHFQKSRVS